jgi:N-acetylglucosamine kinase-like BadF-type ATPase
MTKKPRETAKDRLALGVDRGGTRIRIVLINGLGAEVKRVVRPTVNLRLLPELIIKTAAAWGLKPHVPAIIASRGVMTRKWKKPFLLRKLKGRINLLDVISDAEAAYMAAHGAGNGALLIAGTGSVVFLRRPGKAPGRRFQKIGGHSPPGGDPGSGLWIGTRFLKLRKKGKPGLGRPARAAWARQALQLAETGDSEAMCLTRKAQEELSDLLAAAVKKHRGPGPLRVALAGGLMHNDFFRKTFIALTRKRLAPVRAVFITLKCPAERAAAELAMKMDRINKRK